MTTEEKALALVNAENLSTHHRLDAVYPGQLKRALIAAIEAHEADKKAFSDALRDYFGCQISDVAQGFLGRFILPDPEPDPLVAALANVPDEDIRRIADSKDVAVCRSRIADALRGYKIERIEQ